MCRFERESRGHIRPLQPGISSLLGRAEGIGVIGVIGPSGRCMVVCAVGVLVGSATRAPMPPMPPMVSVLGGLLEGVGCLAPPPDCLLPGQDEARNARTGKVLPGAQRDTADRAPGDLPVRSTHRIELAHGHRLIAMFLPPEGEQVADLLPATIACLCLADPLNRVLTAERRAAGRGPSGTIARSCQERGHA